MSQTTLHRTIRRCTAVLAIPLALIPMVFVAWLRSEGYLFSDVVLETADEIALLVLLGAFVYLIGSVALQLKQVSAAEQVPSSQGSE